MKQPALATSIVTRLGTTGSLGLAILASTAAIWWLVQWLLEEQGIHFSRIFWVLLRLDLVYLPWFFFAALLATLLGTRAGPLVPMIEGLGRHPWRSALVLLFLMGALAQYIYQAHPLSMDEYAVLFQSQVFAAGSLTGHFPPEWIARLIPPWFEGTFFVVSPVTGNLVSAYWPGFALMMTPFSLVNLAWLCNPALTAISFAVLMLTMRRLTPSTPAAVGWAAAFALASPVFLVMGVSFYAMTAIMLANMLFIWGFFSPRPKTLFWSGVAGSIALTLHNPLPHLLFALPWILWLIRKRGLKRDLFALLAGYLPLTLLLGMGWLVLKGHVSNMGEAHETATSTALMELASRAFVLPDKGVLFMRTAGFAKLWLWATPGLIVLAALGWWRGRRDPYVALLAESALLTFIGFLFVPFDQGHGWGFRYFHSVWFVLPLLAAQYVASSDTKSRNSVKPLAGALTLSSLVLVIPIYLLGTRDFVTQLISQVPPVSSSSPLRLTFIYPNQGFYAADLIQNDPFLRGDDLRMLGKDLTTDATFAKSLSPKAKEVASAQAGRMWQLPNHRETTYPGGLSW